jgi:hypothetical protein
MVIEGNLVCLEEVFCKGKTIILPILTLDGIIAYDIVEESVTSEQFVHFLRELVVCSNSVLWSATLTFGQIPLTNPYPGL